VPGPIRVIVSYAYSPARPWIAAGTLTGGRDDGGSAAARADRITLAHSGTSVPGVRSPTQISASGSWRRQSSAHTAVISSALGCTDAPRC